MVVNPVPSHNNAMLDGEIFIGRELSSFRRFIRIKHTDFLRHAIIVGSTGSGKTTTAQLLAEQLSVYGDVIIFDWNGEYQVRFPNFFLLNPLKEGLSIPLIDVSDLVSILEEVLDLTPPQRYLLIKSIENVKELSINNLFLNIEEYPIEAKWMLETKMSLLRKLYPLKAAKFNITFDNYSKHIISFGKLSSVIIDLSRIRESLVKKLYVLLVLKLIEAQRTLRRKERPIYIFIEEAHNAIKTNSTLIERMISEVRKLRVGIALITQSPHSLGHKVLLNCNVRVVHALKSREDLELIGKSMGLSRKEWGIIPRLDVGEAVIDSPSLNTPTLVKIGHY